MTAIRLVCPTRQSRYLPALDIEVAHGDTIDVPADIAGRAPVEGQPEQGEPGKRGHKPAVPADPGEGLLAQSDVWVEGRKSDLVSHDADTKEGDA